MYVCWTRKSEKLNGAIHARLKSRDTIDDDSPIALASNDNPPLSIWFPVHWASRGKRSWKLRNEYGIDIVYPSKQEDSIIDKYQKKSYRTGQGSPKEIPLPSHTKISTIEEPHIEIPPPKHKQTWRKRTSLDVQHIISTPINEHCGYKNRKTSSKPSSGSIQ